MDIFVIISKMVELFILIGLGYFLFKINIFDENLNKKLTTFLLNVTTPALIIASVLNIEKRPSLMMVYQVFFLAIIVFMILPFIGHGLAFLLKVKREDKGLYVFMTIFSNIGFMGYPVMKAIFGNEAVFYTAIFGMVFNVLIYTYGVYLFSKKGDFSWNLKSLINPAMVASFIVIGLFIFDWKLPLVLTNTLTTVGNITTPFAMLLIGSSLALMNLNEIFDDYLVFTYTLLKQVLLPLLAYPIIRFLLKDPYLVGITFVLIAMPVGNSALLFATQYQGDYKLAAKSIFLTTLTSVITIPLFVYLFLI